MINGCIDVCVWFRVGHVKDMLCCLLQVAFRHRRKRSRITSLRWTIITLIIIIIKIMYLLANWLTPVINHSRVCEKSTANCVRHASSAMDTMTAALFMKNVYFSRGHTPQAPTQRHAYAPIIYYLLLGEIQFHNINLIASTCIQSCGVKTVPQRW